MELNSQVLTIISTLAGTFIGSLFTYLATRTAVKSSERKQYKEIAIKAAIENWKERIENAKIIADRSGKEVYLPHFDVFLIHTIKLIELTINKKFNADNISKILEEVNRTSRNASDYVNNLSNKIKSEKR
jgi:hypothetical protein